MHTDFRIVPCTDADCGRLSLIGRATFLETFAGVLEGEVVMRHCDTAHSRAAYQALLGGGGDAWLACAAPGDAPVGYALLAPAALPVATAGGRDLELKRIYLLDRFQGHGLGKALLEAVVHRARARGAAWLLLAVFAGNAPAQEFYRGCGFETLGKDRFVVGGQTYDGVVMGLRLALEAA